MLIVTYLLKTVGKRTSIFRRLQMRNDKLCVGCSSVLRDTTKPAPCSIGPECISYLSREQRDTQEGLQWVLEELRQKKANTNKSENPLPADLALKDDHEHGEAIRVDENSLVMPRASALVESEFSTCADRHKDVQTQAQQCDDFVPRSLLNFSIGQLSAFCGLAWWIVESFDDRLRTMATFFDFRDALAQRHLTAAERELLELEAGLFYRVNQLCRTDARVTDDAYKHCQLQCYCKVSLCT
jgi:hypothetical protein